jgi:predicted Rossmann fold flavoprotein
MNAYIRSKMISYDSPDLGRKRGVIVVGGGPAGLMAAGMAASLGAHVTLLEKMSSPGRKLSITGKGRCNLTNSAPLEQFIDAFGPNGRFLRQAFMRFFNSDLVALCQSFGIQVELEPGGKFFPVGNCAPELARAFTQWAVERGVVIVAEAPVTEILTKIDSICGVRVGRHREYPADALILATGGLSYPETGSTGDGYELARTLGHTIVPTRPVLVPLETKGDIVSRLQGLSLHDVSVRLLLDQKPIAGLIGDLMFTHYGLSGPVILLLSRLAVDCLQTGKGLQVSIDLLPSMDERALEAHLTAAFNESGKKQLSTILKELLPVRLVTISMEINEFAEGLTGNQVTVAERRRLRHWLKDFRLDISGHRSYDEAVVTAGGVDLREIDPRTMQSRLVKGLYFAGELLDIDGPTGGFNLQAAFSTGWLAGYSAAGGSD